MKPSAYLHLISRNPGFRRLWLAHVISLGGDWFNSIALFGLVIELTGSGTASALVLAANILPGFLFAPIAGGIADRFDRKKVMIVSDLMRVGLALGMLVVRSPGTVWIGIACLFGIATFSAFFMPASGAALPNLVGISDLKAANALMGSSWGTMLAVGSALGGLVATAFGRDTAFMVNAASFLVSALLIATVKGSFVKDDPDRAKSHPLHDIAEGFRYARGNRSVVALIAAKGGFGMGVGVVAILPLIATERFDAGDIGIGLLFGARGVGALLGPFIASAFVGEDRRRLFLAIGGAMGLYGLAYSVLPLMPTIGAAAALATVAHLGGGSQWVLSSYGLQSIVEDRIRGRILALDLGLVSLTISISSVAGGSLTDVFGVGRVMTGLALLEITYAVVWLLATRRVWSEAEPEPEPEAV